MKHLMRLALLPLLVLSMGAAHAANYADTIAVFKNAGASGTFLTKLCLRRISDSRLGRFCRWRRVRQRPSICARRAYGRRGHRTG